MKCFFVVCLSFLTLFKLFSQNNYALFPICVNGFWGFIDSTGREVISPKYLSAGDFVEGLAPVQIGGRFGYIGLSDRVQIEARFDYAEPFQEELGKVWIDSKPFFVDKTGRATYEYIYPKMEGFKSGNSRAIITTETQKMGVIDRSGEFIIDTGFYGISGFMDKFVVGYRDSSVIANVLWEDTTYAINRPAVALLDSNGKVVIPTGIYEDIVPEGRMANVRFIGDWSDNSLNFITPDGHFHKITESQYRTWRGTGKIPDFNNDGQSLVENRRSDTSKPYPDAEWIQLGNKLWAYKTQHLYHHWRLWDEETGKTSEVDFLLIDTVFGVRNGVLRVLAKGQRMAYINRQGETIWQENAPKFSYESARKKMFTVQRAEYVCSLNSRLIEDTILSQKYDRYCHSSLVANEKTPFLPDSIGLILRQEDTTTLHFRYEAFKCYFFNGSKDTLLLGYSSSYKPILQALGKNGEWQSIGYQSPIICRSGEPMIYLAPKEYFEYAMPIFEGEMETQLRAVMWSPEAPKQGQRKLLISNSVKTKINPGQLWRIPQYSPFKVLTPYSERGW